MWKYYMLLHVIYAIFFAFIVSVTQIKADLYTVIINKTISV